MTIVSTFSMLPRMLSSENCVGNGDVNELTFGVFFPTVILCYSTMDSDFLLGLKAPCRAAGP